MEKTPIWKRLVRWLPAAGWYAVIWALSAQTGPESQSVSNGVLGLVGYDIQNPPSILSGLLPFLVRKGAHMAAFFTLTALLILALWPLIKKPALRGGLALVLCAALAGLDEFHQTFVPGRSGSLSDVLVDLLGGVCFLLLWALVHFIRTRRKARHAPAAAKP